MGCNQSLASCSNDTIAYEFLWIGERTLKLSIPRQSDDFTRWLAQNPVSYGEFQVCSDTRPQLLQNAVHLRGKEPVISCYIPCYSERSALEKAKRYHAAISAALRQYSLRRYNSIEIEYELTVHCDKVYLTVIYLDSRFAEWLRENPQKCRGDVTVSAGKQAALSADLVLCGRDGMAGTATKQWPTRERAQEMRHLYEQAIESALTAYQRHCQQQIKDLFVAGTSEVHVERLPLEERRRWLQDMTRHLAQLADEWMPEAITAEYEPLYPSYTCISQTFHE